MAKQMKDHCVVMTTYYQQIEALVVAENPTEKELALLLYKIERRQKWYSPRADVAKAIDAKMNPTKVKAKVKSKAKPKGKA